MKRFLSLTGCCCALVLSTGSPAWAQIVTRVSTDSSGSQSNDESYYEALSADGRYVAFYSDASNLVPGDTNGTGDVFLHDRRNGITTLISVDSTGVQGNGESVEVAISLDGRYVAFGSGASNFVPGDTNGADDIFVHDVWTGSTTRVSVDSNGAEANGRSGGPALSGNGHLVSFWSVATNLVTGDTNGKFDVFVHDLTTGSTVRASVDSAGIEGNGDSLNASFSADGTRLAFGSSATNLIPGAPGGIFVRDLVNGTTTCPIPSPSGVPIFGSAASFSGNGRFLVFQSGASSLVPGDTNGVTDMFVHDLGTGVTKRVSVDSNGVQGNGISSYYSISYSGRFVAFGSQANNLVPNDTNGVKDIFLHDCRLGTTKRMSVNAQFAQSDGWSSTPAISADGRHVAFYSDATNLVPGDTNGIRDVFVRRLR